MKHKLPRLLTLLLTLGASLTNANAQTTDTSITIGYVEYTIADGEATVVDLTTNYDGIFPSELTIPQSIDVNDTSYPVTSIADWCAFGRYPHSLKKLILPEGLKKIGRSVFNCHNISEVILPSTLTEMGDYAFDGTAVSKIEIPASLVDFGEGSFSNCQNLTQISVNKENPYFSTENGILFELKDDKKSLVLYPAGRTASTYDNYDNLANIKGYAFNGCKNLKNINFKGDRLENIGLAAFKDCINLQTIKLPEKVINIQQEAFQNCEQLLSINLPSTLTMIWTRAFKGCASLSTITLPASLKYLTTGYEYDAFSGCESLQEINVNPENNFFTSIDGILYNKGVNELLKYPEGSSVTDYTLPETVTELPEFAFNNCKLLERVNLHSGLSAIPKYAFANSGIKRVVIPEGVLSIGDNAFYNCKKLADFYIPENVITVGAKAFAESNLQGIVLGSRLRNIGEDAFADCNALQAVTTLSKDIKPGLKMLANCTRLSDGTAKFFVLDSDCADMFKAESAFSGFDIKTIPSYNITAGEGGSIEVANQAGAPNPYPCMLTDISAQPSSEEYTFENWSSNANQFDGTTDPDLSFAMPLDDFNLKANFTSLSSVSEITDQDVKIMATDTGIEIQGAKWVNVYSVSGNHIYSGVSTVISNLQKGIYIVEADGEISKVALR